MVERTPEHIAIPSTADGAPRRVVQIACGSAHNVVRCDDGAAVSWGVGGRGQLARGKPAALRPDPTKRDYDTQGAVRDHLTPTRN